MLLCAKRYKVFVGDGAQWSAFERLPQCCTDAAFEDGDLRDGMDRNAEQRFRSGEKERERVREGKVQRFIDK